MLPEFGHQLRFAAAVLEAHARPLDFGDKVGERIQLAQQYSRVLMQIVVTLVLLTLCLILLLRANQNDNLQKAATGFIGAIVGYWLR